VQLPKQFPCLLDCCEPLVSSGVIRGLIQEENVWTPLATGHRGYTGQKSEKTWRV